MRTFAAKCIATAVLVGVGCSGNSNAPAKFNQTWSESYGSTTCEQWSSEMTAAQRFTGAADMLVGSQEVDGGTRLPSDTMIKRFQADVSEACEPIGSNSLKETAVAVYLVGKDTYGP